MTENGGLHQVVNGGNPQYWDMSHGEGQSSDIVQMRIARARQIMKGDPQLEAAKFDRCCLLHASQPPVWAHFLSHIAPIVLPNGNADVALGSTSQVQPLCISLLLRYLRPKKRSKRMLKGEAWWSEQEGAGADHFSGKHQH